VIPIRRAPTGVPTLLLALPLAALTCPHLGAQEVAPTLDSAAAPSNVGVLFSGGFGLGTQGMAGLFSLSVHGPADAFIARTAAAFEFTLFTPGDEATDIAVLYGRHTRREGAWARIAGGPALVRTTRPGEPYDCALFFCNYLLEESTTVGLALQADAVWTPARAFGVGVTAFGNVNSEMPFGGMILSLHFGAVGNR
jgi:hypothetical protein